MTKSLLSRIAAVLGGACLIGFAAGAANPYLPLWEYIPDGEPYIFEDPDNPGQYRVYVYGSHDIEISAYCGRDQVVWSASVDDLLHWRYGGVIFSSVYDANGKPLNPDGKGDILYAPDVVEKVGPDGKKTFSSCPQPLPASGSFSVSHPFTSGGQSIGTSASASVLPMHIQD